MHWGLTRVDSQITDAYTEPSYTHERSDQASHFLCTSVKNKINDIFLKNIFLFKENLINCVLVLVQYKFVIFFYEYCTFILLLAAVHLQQ